MLWREEIDEAADGAPKAADGSLGGFSQMRFELRKGFLVWVEVRTIRRRIKQARARRLDHRADGGTLVARQIVHHDDVAWLEFGDENLRDIGLKGVPVNGTVEDERRRDAADAKPGDEGRRLPVAVRDARPQSLPARATPMRADHLRRGPGSSSRSRFRG